MNGLETTAFGGLLGAGGYGALRILHDSLKKVDAAAAPKLDPSITSDKLTINLPPKQKKEEGLKTAEDGDMPTWAKIPLGVAAGAAGFMGAGKLHDMYQTHVATNDLDAKKKKYQEMLATLQQSKTASETPIVDNFCEKLAAELPDDITVEDFVKVASWDKLMGRQDGSTLTSNSGTDSAMSHLVYPAGAALATFGAMKFLADRTKRRREEDAGLKDKLPQQIDVHQG